MYTHMVDGLEEGYAAEDGPGGSGKRRKNPLLMWEYKTIVVWGHLVQKADEVSSQQ